MDDLISRQAAIDALDSINCFGWVEDSWAKVSGIIEHVPAAQPERKKGRWIDMDDHVMCSCCGATHYGVDKNYCPNCGAKMEKGETDGNQR